MPTAGQPAAAIDPQQQPTEEEEEEEEERKKRKGKKKRERILFVLQAKKNGAGDNSGPVLASFAVSIFRVSASGAASGSFPARRQRKIKAIT